MSQIEETNQYKNKMHLSIHREQVDILKLIKMIESCRSYNEVIIMLIATYEHKWGKVELLYEKIEKARKKRGE